jgi:hypothetical protein
MSTVISVLFERLKGVIIPPFDVNGGINCKRTKSK